jgi:type VI secretion system secreted protein Hcp
MFLALVGLALPLLSQERQFEATIQFSGEKAEAISSFSWGVSHSRSTTGEGGNTGNALFSELRFSKPVTQLSNTLFLGCITGKHFPSVVITVAKKKGKDKGQQFLVVTMSDVLVSSYQQSGGEGDATDTTSLTYADIESTLVNP